MFLCLSFVTVLYFAFICYKTCNVILFSPKKLEEVYRKVYRNFERLRDVMINGSIIYLNIEFYNSD